MIRPRRLTPRRPGKRAALATCALLLSACATGVDAGVDASVKDPFGPDASIGSAPYGVPLYLRGTFNDFDTSYPLGYEGANRYTAVIPLSAGAHELKVADADFAAATTFAIDANGPGAIQLDTPAALAPAAGEDSNIQLVVPETGTYRFELSAANRAAPVLLISLASLAPYRDALYLRGSFNDFDTSASLPFQGSGRYVAELTLEAGTHQLRIADAAFSEGTTFTTRAPEPAPFPLDAPTPLAQGSEADDPILLELEVTGTYRFELHASSLAAPLLIVSLAAPAPYGVPLYVRGTFNDFDTSLRLQYRARDRYAATLALDAGSHGFKIADQDFTPEHTFAASATQPVTIELDRDIALVPAPGTGNETRVAATRAGTYELTLTATDPAAPVLRVRLAEPDPSPR